jgi:hypothetical protein
MFAKTEKLPFTWKIDFWQCSQSKVNESLQLLFTHIIDNILQKIATWPSAWTNQQIKQQSNKLKKKHDAVLLRRQPLLSWMRLLLPQPHIHVGSCSEEIVVHCLWSSTSHYRAHKWITLELIWCMLTNYLYRVHIQACEPWCELIWVKFFFFFPKKIWLQSCIHCRYTQSNIFRHICTVYLVVTRLP